MGGTAKMPSDSEISKKSTQPCGEGGSHQAISNAAQPCGEGGSHQASTYAEAQSSACSNDYTAIDATNRISALHLMKPSGETGCAIMSPVRNAEMQMHLHSSRKKA